MIVLMKSVFRRNDAGQWAESKEEDLVREYPGIDPVDWIAGMLGKTKQKMMEEVAEFCAK